MKFNHFGCQKSWRNICNIMASQHQGDNELIYYIFDFTLTQKVKMLFQNVYQSLWKIHCSVMKYFLMIETEGNDSCPSSCMILKMNSIRAVEMNRFNTFDLQSVLYLTLKWKRRPRHRFGCPKFRRSFIFAECMSSLGWWFETASWSLWRHCNANRKLHWYCSSTSHYPVVT